jgi:hypothetical protein
LNHDGPKAGRRHGISTARGGKHFSSRGFTRARSQGCSRGRRNIAVVIVVIPVDELHLLLFFRWQLCRGLSLPDVGVLDAAPLLDDVNSERIHDQPVSAPGMHLLVPTPVGLTGALCRISCLLAFFLLLLLLALTVLAFVVTNCATGWDADLSRMVGNGLKTAMGR